MHHLYLHLHLIVYSLAETRRVSIVVLSSLFIKSISIVDWMSHRSCKISDDSVLPVLLILVFDIEHVDCSMKSSLAAKNTSLPLISSSEYIVGFDPKASGAVVSKSIVAGRPPRSMLFSTAGLIGKFSGDSFIRFLRTYRTYVAYTRIQSNLLIKSCPYTIVHTYVHINMLTHADSSCTKIQYN